MTRADQSIPKTLLLYLKRNVSQTLKVATQKKFFLSVYIIDTTCFGECLLFHLITRRHYFLYKFIVTQRLGEAAMLLYSLKQAF